MRAILRVGRGGAFLGAAAILVVAWMPVASAEAAPRTVAGWGASAGRVDLPEGVAVDQSTGELYVADRNNNRVDKFDSAGNFLLAWGYGVADGKSEELQVCGPTAEPSTKRCFATNNTVAEGGDPANNVRAASIAVDQASHDVYAVDSNNLRVSKFTPDGAFLYMVGRNVNKTKAKEEGSGAPYSQQEKDICTAADLAAGEVCGAGTSGSASSNEFTNPTVLAVDSTGVVWVGDSNRLASFDSGGTPGAEIALPGSGRTAALAPDPEGNLYLMSEALPGIRKLHPDGSLYPSPYPLDEGGAPSALAVDGAGNVYIGDKTAPYRFKVYDAAGAPLSQFGAGEVIGKPEGNALAVDGGSETRPATLYVASSGSAKKNNPTAEEKERVAVQAFDLPQPGPLPEGLEARDREPTSATFAATLNPEGHETHYRFQYLSQAAYEEQGESFEGPATEVTPEETLPGTEFEGEEISAEIEGLIPDTEYRFRLLAENEAGEVAPEAAFATRTAVGIEAEWASAVAAYDATLNAELDPLGVAVEEWWVEYDTAPYGSGEAPHGVHLAGGSLSPGFGAIGVEAPLGGLAPTTSYHYRFAARDEREVSEGGETVKRPFTTYGEDRTFTTQPAGLDFPLADGRAWEMVSPPDKHGGRIVSPDEAQGGQVQAAADGEALAYLSYGSLEANPEGNRLIEMSSQFARRGPGGDWSTVDITPPHTAVTAVALGYGLDYKLFSPELGQALMEPRDQTPLSPQATERTPYLRTNSSPPAYEPLVSAANVAPGTPPFGGPPPGSAGDFEGAVHVQGASADLGHVVLGSRVALVAGAAEGSLYEWERGALEPVSVKPGGGAAVQAELGAGVSSVRGAVSEDGSRVFWSTGSGGEGAAAFALYARDTARDETARLDEVAPGGFGTGKAEPLFQGASAEGRFAFFTDPAQLTEDSGEEGADLYRWQTEGAGGCEEAGGCLTDLSAQTASSGEPHFGESASVQGLVPGIAENGTRAYFVARGVLDPRPNREGESASPGQPNLYAWHEGQGVRFIAILAEEDEHDWGAPGAKAYQLTAAASPSGRYLAFMSSRPLSGYDNRDVSSGEAAQEVFGYDAVTEELTCLSCDPSGKRPQALAPVGYGPEETLDPQHLWQGVAVAGTLPEATNLENDGASLYRPRAVQDDGRVFFNAADSLVSGDSNGDGDVYEYEPGGTGSCGSAAADAGTALVPGGCVSLLSSGRGEGTAAFLDASEGGSDVFFYTSAPLSVTDEDEELDVYDARERGEPATLRSLGECQGEACQPPASAPQAQTPASAIFQGPGNVRGASRGRRCPKGRRKGAVRCVKPNARHRHHSRHHRRRAVR